MSGKLRLTKQQRAYQEQVLLNCGMQSRFKPSSTLVADLANGLSTTEGFYRVLSDELAALKAKSPWRFAWERWVK